MGEVYGRNGGKEYPGWLLMSMLGPAMPLSNCTCGKFASFSHTCLIFAPTRTAKLPMTL